MAFVSDYAEDNVLTIFYTQRESGDWKEPVALPRHINNRLNFARGFTLSPDGKTIYITSAKSGGVGGYDLWGGSIQGTSWGDLQNLYAPINSRFHDACVTLTPDGTTLYFMRCEKMDVLKADNCKILVSKKSPGGRWEEPTELPANVNTGNSQVPRIMADAETLIFSSNRFVPNKGGMDLYVSKLKEDGSWTDPVPLDFVNTEKDDQFVSSISTGRYLLKDAPGTHTNELLEYLIPDELRPRGILKLEGVITDATGAPAAAAYASVTDLKTAKRFYSGRPDARDGSFFVYLKEGSTYELSIDPEQGNVTYYSRRYDLTGNPSLNTQKVKVALKTIAVGDEIELDAIRFKSHSSELDDPSAELRRLSRLVKSSPQLSFELQVLLAGYEEDSIQSGPDLTEVSIDSVIMQIEDIDTLGQLYSRDSLIVKTTYHNNRTQKQAETLLNELVALGVDRNNLSYFVNVRPEAVLENRRTSVRMVVRRKK
jgi:hypothetical protein